MDASQVLTLSIGDIQMRNDCVLVRVRSKHDDYRGPLIMPQETGKRDPGETMRAVVVAVGPGYYPEKRLAAHRTPMNECPPGSNIPQGTELSPIVELSHRIEPQVKVGDEVLLESTLAGDAITIDNREHRIVRESEIVAVLEPDEPGPLTEHPDGSVTYRPAGN